MVKPRLVLDDGTPRCLPKWACDQLVSYRLRCADLQMEVGRLKMELARERGEDPFNAAREAIRDLG